MSRARAASVLVAFIASLAWVVVTPWCTRDGASVGDFVAAARTLGDELPLGGIVLIHPPWRDDAVAGIRAAGMVQAPAVVTTALAPRHGEPLPPLVALVDEAAPPLPRALRARVVSERLVGAVRVVRFAADAAERAARDLSDALPFAEVSVERADGIVRCVWSPLARRHACPGLPDWVHVGVEELRIAGRAQRCTWAHPVTDGVVVVHFPSVHLQGALTLELALTDGAADNTALAPVHAALMVDEQHALALDKQPGSRGFVRATAPTGPARDAAVELRFTTPSDGQRHACFRLTSERAP
ncbi:MAG: hypothetical protein IT383_10830 [Deltaproteobacteria bacterium]|nr:hypothetical protein [Deltaproteobacteria bacterium]